MTTERPQQQDDEDHIGHIIERTLPVKPAPKPESDKQEDDQPKGSWPFPVKES